MGERGPQPKPTALKLAAGNPGKRPLNENEPAPPAGSPVPPDFLNPAALAIWEKLVPPLVESRLVTAIDWPFVARYCVKLARWIYLAGEIEGVLAASPGSRGTTYPIYAEVDEVGSDGKPFKAKRIRYVAEFPWAAEWRALDRDLRADETRLGISASARSRISVPKGEKTEAEKRRDFFRRNASA